MRTKYVLSLLVAVLMLSSFLTASRVDAPAYEHGGPAIDSRNGSSAPYPLVLVFPGTPQPDELRVEEEINRYLIPLMNAVLDIRPVEWGQWNDKRSLMIASREPVDIVFTAQWANHVTNVGKGAFLELSDLLNQYGQGITGSLDPAFWEGSRINDKIYGIPANKELAGQGGVIYRRDIAEELQLDFSQVRTIADLEPLLLAVKQQKPGLTPLYMRDGETFNAHFFGNYDFLGDDKVEGVVLKDSSSRTIVPRYALDRYQEILRVTRRFYKQGLINKDAAIAQLSPTDALKTGQVFMIVSPLKPGKDEEMAASAGMQGKLRQLEMNERTISTGETSGSMLAISSTSRNPVLAMSFINLLHTDKYLNNLLSFGIEGIHFQRSGETITTTGQTPRYSPAASWMFGNQFLNYVWDTEAPDKWDQFRAFNKDAKRSPALGFAFNSEPVKHEIAALVNVRREYLPVIDTGSVDPDKILPLYIEKMKAAGLDKVIQEKQRQFDAFLAQQQAQ